MNLKSVVLAALLLMSAAASHAQNPLTPHKATYKVKISVLGGELHTELREIEGGYSAVHEITPTGMSRMFARGRIRETSSFDAMTDGLRPRDYISEDSLTRDGENAIIHFDWEAGEARGTVDGAEVVSAMAALAHDRVSIQYALMHDLLNGEPNDRYTMFEIDRLRPVEIRDAGTRIVDVPAGEFEVIGISHQAEGSKRVTTMWCAPELGYLPVVIEQHRKGKLRVRATLTDYEPLAEAPEPIR